MDPWPRDKALLIGRESGGSLDSSPTPKFKKLAETGQNKALGRVIFFFFKKLHWTLTKNLILDFGVFGLQK